MLQSLKQRNDTSLWPSLEGPFPTPCHDDMHCRVYTASQAKRAAEIARHNKATNVTAINFDDGEFVLISVPTPQKVNKRTVTWTGPARGLYFTTPLVAKTQILVDGKVKDIHVSRLKFYNSATLDVTDELKECHLPTFNSLPCRELKEVRRLFRRRFDVLVSWVGSRERILDRCFKSSPRMHQPSTLEFHSTEKDSVTTIRL